MSNKEMIDKLTKVQGVMYLILTEHVAFTTTIEDSYINSFEVVEEAMSNLEDVIFKLTEQEIR